MKIKAVILLLSIALVCCCCEEEANIGIVDNQSDTVALDQSETETADAILFEYYNIYSGAPDIPPAGMTYLTELAEYMVSVGEDDELYFLVGVTSPWEPFPNAPTDGWLGYMYNGVEAPKYLESLAYAEYCAQTGAEVSYASWALLHNLLESGKTPEAALEDAEYKQISSMYNEYMTYYCKIQASYVKDFYISEHVLGGAEYLKEFGFEVIGDPYSFEWLYHLEIIEALCHDLHLINGTMNLLVKCSREELNSLIRENEKYGYIFYASDADGIYYVSNQSPDPAEYYKKVPSYAKAYLSFYDRTLAQGHIEFGIE